VRTKLHADRAREKKEKFAEHVQKMKELKERQREARLRALENGED
jgi:hypothetical protein